MNDILGLLAEIAAAFTGFAALVSAFGSAPSRADQKLDRLRMRNLVEVGVTVVLMATLPLVLFQSDRPSDWVWTVSSVVLLVAMVTIVFIHASRSRVVRVAEMAGYSRLGELVIWGLGLSTVGVLVFGLVSPHVISRDLAYLWALWLLTAILGVYFVRIAASLLTHKLSGGDERE